MISFAIRNIRIFLRDRTAVMLSFLAEAILVVLYILFLRDNLLEGMEGIEDAEMFVDIWMTAGIMAMTSVTTTMGAYGVMVEDKMKHTDREFRILPLKRGEILGGYMICAIFIGMIMTVIVMYVSIIYIKIVYGINIIEGCVISLLAVMALTVCSNSVVILFFVSFLESSNALAALCTVIGTLLGFLTGIYIPIGELPEYVRVIVLCCPASHCALLFRKVLLDDLIYTSFLKGKLQLIDVFNEKLGIVFYRKGEIIPVEISVLFIVLTTVAVFIVTLFVFYRRRKD